MIKSKITTHLSLIFKGKKRKLVIGGLIVLFLLVMPRLVNQGVQASQVFVDNKGVHFPGSGKDEKTARLLKKLLVEAEKEADTSLQEARKEEVKEEDLELESVEGNVIYMGKSLSADSKNPPRNTQKNNGKGSPALVIPRIDKNESPPEQPGSPSAENPQDKPALFLPDGPGGGGEGGLIPPTPPGNQPPGPGNPQPPKPPKPSPPPAPPFRWKYADPNRPGFEKIKLADNRTSYSVEEIKNLTPGEDYIPGEIIVKYKKPRVESLVMSQCMSLSNTKTLGVKSLSTGKNAPEVFADKLFLIKVSEDANIGEVCEEVMQNPEVEYAEPNYIMKIYKTPNDPDFSRLWGMLKIQADKAWDISEGSSSVIVGVSDTGVDGNHPDLKDNLVNGQSFVGGSPTVDRVGHGTHVAGTIAAVGNNNTGVIGVAPKVKIMPLKISDSRSIEVARAIQSITYAADNGAKVLNMSWGGCGASNALHDAIKYAYGKDVVLVAAAGNRDCPGVSYPAAYPEVIAVSATDSNDQLAPFSSYGPEVEVAAPGVEIYSTVSGGSYQSNSGTSMASPHVVGVVALIRSVFPNLKVDEVRQRLCSTADDLGTPGKDNQFGYGRINAFKAIQGGSNPSPTPSPGPNFEFTPPGYLTSSLKVAALTGNGDNIIFVSTNEYKKDYKESLLYVLKGNGKPLKGFPLKYEGRAWSTPAIYDIDKDEALDIITTTETLKDNSEANFSEQGYVNFQELSDAVEHKVVIISVEEPFRAPSSAVGEDINGDGEMETVVLYLDSSKIDSGLIEQGITIFDSQGKEIQYQPKARLVYKATEEELIQACTPVIGDLNDDSKVEIVVGDAIVDGKLCLLVALDSEGNVVAKVENPTGKASLYSRIVAVKNMYMKGKTAIILTRATEDRDEVYVIDLFGGGISAPWPIEIKQPFGLYDPIALNIDGDNNWELAIRGKDEIHSYHHEGSFSQGFPVKDKGGNIRAIRAGRGRKDLLVGNAIYGEGGKIVGRFANVAEDAFVMDQVIGKFSSSDKENIILLIVDKEGKEHLIADVLPERGTEETSPWPMYRKLMDNRGVEEIVTEPTPTPTPSPSPSPGPANNPPQFGPIRDHTANLHLWFTFSVTDPDGDAIVKVKGVGTDPNFDPWNPAFPSPIVTNNDFTWAMGGAVPPGTYPVKLIATDSRGAEGTSAEFRIIVSRCGGCPNQ